MASQGTPLGTGLEGPERQQSRAPWPVTCLVTKQSHGSPGIQCSSQLDDSSADAACPAERGPGLPASTLEWNFTQNEEEGLLLFMDNK